MLSDYHSTVLQCVGVGCVAGVVTYAAVRMTENIVNHVAAHVFSNIPMPKSEAFDNAIQVSVYTTGIVAGFHVVTNFSSK